MSTYQSCRTVSRIAGSAISPYRFVVLAAGDSKYDHVAVAQAEMDGISAEGVAADGDCFPMVVPDGGIAKVEAGAAVSVGDAIGSDNVGRAITAVSGAGNFTAGKALTAATAAGDIIEVQFLKDRDQA
jgi:hypothetical protein